MRRRLLHHGPDTLEELVERHVVQEAKGHRLPSAGLTTSRREALALYREILRTTRLFTWTNEQGVPWYESYYFFVIGFRTERETKREGLGFCGTTPHLLR